MNGVPVGRHADAWGRVAEDSPRVSVVIATHNRAASLRGLLDIIRRSEQPPGGLEVVVVDDGSTDATAQVAAAAGVRCLTQSNHGPAAARERGWRAARGELIVFFDDDVLPEPDAIVNLVTALEDADAVGAAIHPRDKHRLVAHYMHVDGMVSHRLVDDQVVWLLIAATAVRRSALERVGGFDLTFYPAGEDVDLACRMVEAGLDLRVEPSAVVAIGCPTRLTQLIGTLYTYGGGFRMLAARHPSFKSERTRSALLRLDPREWLDLYRFYRTQASVRRSLAFLALHGFAVLPYAAGVVAGQRANLVHRDRNGDRMERPPEPAVDLIGRRAERVADEQIDRAELAG